MNSKKSIYSSNEYQKNYHRKITVLLVLLLATIICFLASLFIGYSDISFLDGIKGLCGITGDNSNNVLIIQKIRLPRILAAFVVGWGLSIAGCVMQSVLKNPMASPSTLGVTNAAVFGANFAIIVFGGGVFNSATNADLFIENPYLIAVVAFICAAVSAMLILGLAKVRRFTPGTIVLAGLAIGALFTAGTTLVQYFAVDTQLSSAVFWSFGDLSRISYATILVILAVVFVGSVVLYLLRWSLNALNVGDTTAKSLGVHTELIRFVTLLTASLITAVCVCFVGLIGFIGLVAPQLIKRFVGSDLRILMPASALTGSILLMISDTLSRVIVWGTSLPVGAVTALFGAPVFIYILLRKKESHV